MIPVRIFLNRFHNQKIFTQGAGDFVFTPADQKCIMNPDKYEPLNNFVAPYLNGFTQDGEKNYNMICAVPDDFLMVGFQVMRANPTRQTFMTFTEQAMSAQFSQTGDWLSIDYHMPPERLWARFDRAALADFAQAAKKNGGYARMSDLMDYATRNLASGRDGIFSGSDAVLAQVMGTDSLFIGSRRAGNDAMLQLLMALPGDIHNPGEERGVQGEVYRDPEFTFSLDLCKEADPVGRLLKAVERVADEKGDFCEPTAALISPENIGITSTNTSGDVLLPYHGKDLLRRGVAYTRDLVIMLGMSQSLDKIPDGIRIGEAKQIRFEGRVVSASGQTWRFLPEAELSEYKFGNEIVPWQKTRFADDIQVALNRFKNNSGASGNGKKIIPPVAP